MVAGQRLSDSYRFQVQPCRKGRRCRDALHAVARGPSRILPKMRIFWQENQPIPGREEGGTSVMRAKAILVVMVCLLPAQLRAQAPPAMDVGARVRVWTPEMRKVTGRVEALTSDALALLPDGQTASVSMPVATLIRIEISHGLLSRKTSAWKRAKWGAVIGAVPGAVSLGLQHEQVGGGSSAAKAAALGAWSGGLFGGLIGAAFGAAHPGENWERVR